MNKNKILGGVYYSFEKLNECRKLQNFVSTKNINLNSILSNLKISAKDCVYAEQVHGNNIAVVNKENKGAQIKGVDALVTNTTNLCLCIKTADCLPLIFYDPTKKVLAVVHAGWKGTLKNISANAVGRMTNRFKVNPRDLIVGIGPSIGPKDYLVKYDVAGEFIECGYTDFLSGVSTKQWELDLLGVNIAQLKQAGVRGNNIETSGLSTLISEDFYSYRRHDAGEFITGGVICE